MYSKHDQKASGSDNSNEKNVRNVKLGGRNEKFIFVIAPYIII